MTTHNWTDHLASLGFARGNGKLPELVNRANTPPALIDLSHWAVTTVSGADTDTFLQGQFSNDIALLSEDAPHQITGYCNPKGRLLAIFQVIRTPEAFLLAAPHAVMEKVLPRLKMFVLRAQVQFSQENDRVISAISTQLSPPASAMLAPVSAIPGYQFVIGSTAEMAEYWKSAHAQHAMGDHRDWTALEIENGVPAIIDTNMEKLIPQQVNLDLVNGVNFKKGCYPGQEIIARIRYRGKPKSRLVPLTAPEPAEPGANLYSLSGGQSVGSIVQCAPSQGYSQGEASSGNDFLLSASITLAALQEERYALLPDQSITASRLDLAYPIPEATPK